MTTKTPEELKKAKTEFYSEIEKKVKIKKTETVHMAFITEDGQFMVHDEPTKDVQILSHLQETEEGNGTWVGHCKGCQKMMIFINPSNLVKEFLGAKLPVMNRKYPGVDKTRPLKSKRKKKSA